MTFYENLYDVCKKKRTTPCAVLLSIGMSKSNATKWKRGLTPRLDVIIKIADKLGVSPATLIKGVVIEGEEE